MKEKDPAPEIQHKTVVFKKILIQSDLGLLKGKKS